MHRHKQTTLRDLAGEIGNSFASEFNLWVIRVGILIVLAAIVAVCVVVSAGESIPAADRQQHPNRNASVNVVREGCR